MRQSSSQNRSSLASALTLQIRHFIAGVILYNQKVADQLGMHATDMQCVHLLELLGPLTPGRLAECTGLTTGGVTVVGAKVEPFTPETPLPAKLDKNVPCPVDLLTVKIWLVASDMP